MVFKKYTAGRTLLLWFYLIWGAKSLGNHQKIGRCTFIVHPVCPDPSISFYLYTRENKYSPQMVVKENITESYFAKSLPNKFILHGFNSDSSLDILQSIKNEYLIRTDVNVWMIDYSKLCSGPTECYLAAVYNLPMVGQCTALFVGKIMELSTVVNPVEAMHMIGFSLGGQLAGQVAEHLKPVKLPRITGLDPALPLYYSTHLNRRLSRNDAKFVDVIHTNALVQGQLAPCGDVDFYVNGGFRQPACINSTKPAVCDHHMAPTYFVESIRSTVGFWAWLCPNTFEYFSGKCPPQGNHELMGDGVNKSARGQYVLHTNGQPPYAQGDWKLRIF